MPAAEIFGIEVAVLSLAVAATGLLITVGGLLWRSSRRPRLELRSVAEGRPVPASMYWNKQFPEARLSMIRLRVHNHGRAPAERVLVDLIHVNEACPDELHLDIRPRPPGDPQWLKVPSVTADLKVVAHNHKTLHYQVDVTLKSPWNGSTALADRDVSGPRRIKE